MGIPKKSVLIPAKECLSIRVDELARENEAKQANNKSFFRVLYLDCQEKRWPRFRMSLLISKDPIKKNPSQAYPTAWVLVDSDVVMLTNKINHHKGVVKQKNQSLYSIL